MPSGALRGRSSERIARGVLIELGYEILETNKMVSLNGEDAFEVDIIALGPDGGEFCVEVKAGEVGVSDVRHAYANGEVLGMRSALVSKGFVNEAARALAEELGVELIRLSEFYVLLEPEELEVVVKTALMGVLNEYGLFPLPSWNMVSDEWDVIRAFAEASSFEEAAEILQMDVSDVGQKLGEMRDRGIYPSGGQSFTELRRHSQQIISRHSIQRRLEAIEKEIKYLRRLVEND